MGVSTRCPSKQTLPTEGSPGAWPDLVVPTSEGPHALIPDQSGVEPRGSDDGMEQGRPHHPSLVLDRDVQATLSAQLLAAGFVVGDPVLQVRGQLRGLHLKGSGQ